MVWSPKDLNQNEIELIMKALKSSGGESGKKLYDKIWSWKINYGKN